MIQLMKQEEGYIHYNKQQKRSEWRKKPLTIILII
jgi:hypothetical protein